VSVRHLGEQLRSWHTLSAWLRGSPQRGLRERLSAFPTPGFGGDGWLKERLTALPPAIPPWVPQRWLRERLSAFPTPGFGGTAG
jgi:hypothetical protein